MTDRMEEPLLRLHEGFGGASGQCILLRAMTKVAQATRRAYVCNIISQRIEWRARATYRLNAD